MIQWMKKRAPETYIIIITNASVDDMTYEKLFTIGVDDFILKPYSPKRILVHVNKGLKQRDLVNNLQRLEKLSLLEPITQEVQDLIYNTIFFKKCLRQEIKKAKRHQHPFSLLLIQIPPKEKIGDRFDIFYMELVKIVKKYTREEDMVGKDNGEIGVILPETDQVGSKALIHRLSSLINDHPSFKTNDTFRMCTQNLFFQSFTYPNQFSLPESLSPVLKELNREYPSV
jgi:PleD family two-component response regulator